MKEFIAKLIGILHDQRIPYAIGGSVASSYYGEARTTMDIDLSLQFDPSALPPLVAAFETIGWHVTTDQARLATQQGGTFLITDGFWKADCFVVKNDAFALTAFDRRRQGNYALLGQMVWFLSPEDVIIHKLRWSQGQLLDRHVRDILAMLRVRYIDLDVAYISQWATTLDAGDLWSCILSKFQEEN